MRKISGNDSNKISDLPFPVSPSVVIRKTSAAAAANGFNNEQMLHLNQSDFIDQKIQNSIKEFFREPPPSSNQ